jgi:hypothetical protein
LLPACPWAKFSDNGTESHRPSPNHIEGENRRSISYLSAYGGHPYHLANQDRLTANWTVLTYRHDTTRELDPQLQTHAVAAGLTYDGVEGHWKALQGSGLYDRRSLASFKRTRVAA